MKILQELISINEDSTEPVEVKDVVTGRNPAIARKYLAALWGKPRLVFNGKPFFSDGGIYDYIEGALEELKAQGFEVDMSISVDGTDDLPMDSLEYQAEVDDFQEVYLGYSLTDDCLYVGVDVWLKEESFNDAWDKEFEDQTGEEFDMDNDEHQKVFNSAWEDYKRNGFVGMLFRLEGSGPFNAEEVLQESGGFYRGIYRSATFERIGLIDLRLD
jgi:hypothetical protein